MDAEINYIHDHCLANGLTLAVAESVTSGRLQLLFSKATGGAQFFQGGITTYNTGQKTKHLQVEPIHALACNAVSQEVAIQMALGVCHLFNCNVGIAVTGYAAPAPEMDIHEPFAFFAITCRGQTVMAQKIVPVAHEPEEVAQEYALQIMHSCYQYFRQQGTKINSEAVKGEKEDPARH
ncbi:CinA family protein [Chitinophaga agrisoli]|nr:CinA family protein [Chitinophaga agrisoli]